jgi:acyl-coenzyme A thioesterase PaaI-like protein
MTDTSAGQNTGAPSSFDLRGGAALGRFVTALRALHDQLVTTDAPEEAFDTAAQRIEQMRTVLAQWHTADSPVGQRWDLPGRGHPLLPPMTIQSVQTDCLRATVEFGQAHVSVAGLVHGGLLPLVFDEALGALMSRSYGLARTAYLKVDYRAPTPVDVVLNVDVVVERVDGRKGLLSGALRHETALLAEAECLMIRM